MSRSKHGSVVGSTETSDGIPTGRALPADAAIEIVVSNRNVSQDVRVGIEPRVDEAKRGLAVVEQLIVDEGEDTGESRGAGTSATDADGLTSVDDDESPAEGGDVGSGTALGVVGGRSGVERGRLALVKLTADGRGLVGERGFGPVESTPGAECSGSRFIGANSVLEGGGTNGRDVGRTSGVCGGELIAGLAARARSTRRDQDSEAEDAHLLELGIELGLVGLGRLLRQILVTVRYGMDERGVGLAENIACVCNEICHKLKLG